MHAIDTIGFIGTGGIAEAMVTGLCRSVHEKPPSRILVSRRSASRSARLEKRFPDHVEVIDDNQEIVDRCGMPVIAVMPVQAEAVLDALRFREDQRVLSLVTGLRLDRVRTLTAPARRVFRAIPMPPVERGVGPLPLIPPDDDLAAVLGRVGTVIPVTDERQFQTLAAASALMASHFELVAETARWLGAQQVPEPQATDYATALFNALATLFAGVKPAELAALSTECLTAGGLNEQVLTELREHDWFETLRARLDGVMARMDRM